MPLIALKMLMGDTAKYIGIIMGVTFAALIMTQQPSIFVGLMSRTFSFITDTSYPDLWVSDQQVRFVDDVKPLSDTQLQRVRGVPGIAWAVPLYKGMLRARTPEGHFQNTMVVGVDDASLIGAPENMVAGKVADLRRADAVIVDRDGAEKYLKVTLPDGTSRPLKIGDTLEINDQRAEVVGIAAVSKGFQSNPVVYTLYSRAVQYAPAERLKMTFVLAGVLPGTDPHTAASAITKMTSLGAYTQQEFKDKTLNYFLQNTGIPINFGIAVGLGFAVGAAVAGQMFFNFASDNARQFATLKAMGLSNMRLSGMILLQALFTGFTGWGIGVGLAAWFGHAMRGSVLAFKMVWQIPVISATGVALIMVLASLIALQKVLRLEPAMVFK